MYNLSLFLHIISAFFIAYSVLYGSLNSSIKISSKLFRINLILLSSMSIVSILTAAWIISIANYSHSSFWITTSYTLWFILILINEGLIRRKYMNAKKQGIAEISVSIQYISMSIIVAMLTFLMIYKPTF